MARREPVNRATRRKVESDTRVKVKRRRSRVPAGSSSRRVSASSAARSFSELLERVQHGGETVTIERNGIPICEVAPVRAARFTVSDLVALLRSTPKPDARYWDVVEAITRNQPLVEPSPWEC